MESYSTAYITIIEALRESLLIFCKTLTSRIHGVFGIVSPTCLT